MSPHVAIAKIVRGSRLHAESGIALILTLLLLMVLSALGLTMMLTVNSDALINRYYRNTRGAFYAADSGLAAAREDIGTQLKNAIPPTFLPNVQPIPPLTENAVATYITNTYGASFRSDSAASGSWPTKYMVNLISLGTPTCTASGGTSTSCTTPAGNPTQYLYTYPYTMESYGQVQGGTRQTTLGESGTITIQVTVTPAAASKASFSAWGMFIDQSTVCDGTTLVQGFFSGPVFTNGGFTFGTGSYNFKDDYGQAGAKVGYQNGNCDQQAAPSDKVGGVTIAPTFQGKFLLSQNKISAPSDSFNQQWAVMDGIGQCPNAYDSCTAGQTPSNAQRNQYLRDVSTNQYPTGGANTGVFLPYKWDSTANAYVMTGGGIMVEGNADSVQLSTTGTGRAQVYTIKQGSTTTTITIDPVANTTVFQSGSKTVPITGVPQQFDTSHNQMSNVPNSNTTSTMLYVDGQITSLSGPGEGVAAVNDGNAVTITAAGNVYITGDIRYKSQPVTTTQNDPRANPPGCQGSACNTPADTLIPGNDTKQALGIYTANGDIVLNNKQSSGNLEIDASVAAIANGGSGGLVNNGNAINQLTIIGGRIQNNIKNINTTTRNVFFDRRYLQSTFAPPWFPSTTVTPAGLDSGKPKVTFQRTEWVNKTPSY